MNYPKSLKMLNISRFNYIDTFYKNDKNAAFVFSYFHDRKDLPLFMHCHDFYEINIITSGQGRHYIEKNVCDVQAGSVFILPPNIYHGYYSSEDTLDIFHLALSNNFMNTYFDELYSLHGYSSLFETEPILRASFDSDTFLSLSKTEMDFLMPELESIVLCEKKNYSQINTLKNAKAISIISTLTMFATEHMLGNEPNGNVFVNAFNNIVEYIKIKYNEKLSIGEIGKKYGMSQSAMAKYFKRIYNLSPIEFLIKTRIKNAKKKLRTSDLSIAQISEECGFFDQAHMNRYFKKYENTTPFKYRKSPDNA